MLDKEIEHFLLRVARWTSRWFNKPKFHIFLHLTEHIRHFGPAIIFATEAFESFNAIIRAKSVHSNRHAPSRDIARAFAQGNRIRHLLSGGFFLFLSQPQPTEGQVPSPNDTEYTTVSADSARILNARFSTKKEDWHCVGPGPISLIRTPNTVTKYLGLDDKKEPKTGRYLFIYSGSQATLMSGRLHFR